MPFNKLSILAYRDLMRNRRRSFFSLLAVALGLALMIGLNGFISGVWGDALENNIRLYTGHVQVRDEDYEKEKLSLQWDELLDNGDDFVAMAQAMPQVETAAPILRASAIVNTVDDSAGVQLQGIDPVSSLHDRVRESVVSGSFLQADDRSGIVIGQGLADELDLEAGRDINLSMINASGQPVDTVFTIRGVFDTGIASFDNNTVFMPLARAQSFTGVEERVSDVTILLHDADDAQLVADSLKAAGIVVLTADEMNQLMQQTLELGMGFYNILYGIVMLVVAVVIANTLLMSVFERIREFGIFASLGMKGRQIMSMMLIEATFLSLMGILLGWLLGGGLVYYLVTVGFDSGEMGSTVEGIAMSTIMYGRFVPSAFLTFALWTLGVILLASLYPAWYAARLEPVEALHSL